MLERVKREKPSREMCGSVISQAAAQRLLRLVESVNYIFYEAASKRNAISIRRFEQPQ